jgi:glycerol-3-phosphate O-acyltransferase/dihydroxyacetone phosphate acyltransferase
MAHLAVHIFFRRIDIEAPQNVPVCGPILIVSNHTNALVDPLVIITAVRRRITATAKHVLANNALLRWIMAACGVVTFHRQQDVGPDSSRRENLQSLQQCEDILAGGGAICIFPEGVSHSDSKLRAFRNGAARIALQYVRDRGNPGRLQIVPTGLLYTAKDRFRSDVLLRFGGPLDVETWLAANPDAPPIDLTHVIEQRVASLTINTPTRREQFLLTWAAEIVATRAERPNSLGYDDESTADYFRLVARLQAGWDSLNQSCPGIPQRLARRIRAYRKQLRRAGITPSEVFLQLNYSRAAFFLLRELELMIIGGPMALFGAINHAVPYFVVKQIATKLSRDKDHWASNAIYPSFVVFPFFYLLQLAAAWWSLPTFWAAIYTIALPYTGYYTVLYGDRFKRAWRRARTFIRFALHPTEQQELASEGREIVEEIRALGKLVERDHETVGASS